MKTSEMRVEAIECAARDMDVDALRLWRIANNEGWSHSSHYREADKVIRDAANKLREMAMTIRTRP